MKQTFGADRRRIDHALAVLGYAERIFQDEPGDALTVVAAAVLHDIGIVEAERKFSSSAARYQEQEGPPVARAILEGLKVEVGVIDHVCRIISSHHSAAPLDTPRTATGVSNGADIDTPEFRVIWDADWLVNLAEEADAMPPDRLRERIARVFRTSRGRQIAAETFLPGP